MTVEHERDATDRNFESSPEGTGAAAPVAERRFETCGSDCRPRDQAPLYPIGTRFAAIIGWW